jgi:hypothetical protein
VEKTNKEQHWQPIIEELMGSGLTASEFALKKGISTHQIIYWRAKFKNKNHVHKINPTFIPIIEKKTTKKMIAIDPVWLADFLLAIHCEKR